VLNKIILIGRMTKDPDLRYTPNGTATVAMTLAVDRNSGTNKTVDFINIVAWRGLAESCNTYLSKGKLAAVEGRLQIRSYEDKNGIKRTVAEVVAENVKFLSPRNDSGTANGDTPIDACEPLLNDEEVPF